MSNVTALRVIPAAKDDSPEPTTDLDLNARALLVLSIDIGALHETVERIKIQVHALAKRHGVD